jgi:hypothetical protein
MTTTHDPTDQSAVADDPTAPKAVRQDGELHRAGDPLGEVIVGRRKDDEGTDMSETKQAWNEVGSRLEELGLKLKLHYEQAAGAPDGDGEVRAALDRLRKSVDEAFDAVGKAVRDPAVKDDARDVARALRTALTSTFAEVSDDLREHLRRRDGD